jgi:hypothetical protein
VGFMALNHQDRYWSEERAVKFVRHTKVESGI